MNILFASTKEKGEFWFPLLKKHLPDDRFFEWPDNNGGDIDVALVATHPKGALAGLPKLKFIQSLWMGVENIVTDPDLLLRAVANRTRPDAKPRIRSPRRGPKQWRRWRRRNRRGSTLSCSSPWKRYVASSLNVD